MAEQELKRDNHFVSQCYLKYWTDNDGKLLVYKKIIPHINCNKPSKRFPSQVGKLYNFYIRYDGNEEKDDLEDLFNFSFENELGNILKKINEDIKLEKLSENESDILMKFVAVQRYKTIDGLNRIKEMSEKVLPKVMKDSIDSMKQSTSLVKHTSNSNIELPIKVNAIEKKDNILDISIEAVNGKTFWLMQMENIMENLYKTLKKHKWKILKSPKGLYWYTSDNPVLTLNYYGSGKYDFHGGFDSKGSNIIVPLTPKHLLITEIGCEEMPKMNIATVPFYQRIQRFICENATNDIYSFSENHIENYVEIKVDDRFTKEYSHMADTLHKKYISEEVPFIKKVK